MASVVAIRAKTESGHAIDRAAASSIAGLVIGAVVSIEGVSAVERAATGLPFYGLVP